MIYRKDTFHNRIAAILIQAGWTVIDTSWSRGRLLDMIIYKPRQKEFWFVEIKTGNRPLTDKEKDFTAQHWQRCVVFNGIDAAMVWCGMKRVI
jgi:hypothetical protein